MSRTDAQAQVNKLMREHQAYLDAGMLISACNCFWTAKRICAEFKVQRAK